MSAAETVRRFMAETDAEAEQMLADAEVKFGHPANWPVPPSRVPRWYEFRRRRHLREVVACFGPLSPGDLDAFYGELHKGQSVYEDAGGYLLRCYRALVALSVEEPYTYQQAAADLIAKTEARQP